MKNLFKGYVLIIGFALIGYSLAYPISLAGYFYENPVIDMLIYLAIFVSSLLLTRSFLSSLKGLKYWAFVLLVLPLVWLKVDFWAYSNLDSPQFVTYLELMLLGIAAYALFKYPVVSNAPKWTYIILVPFFTAGFLFSFFSKAHDLTELLMLFFITGLAVTFWDKQRSLSIGVSIFGIGLLTASSFLSSPKFFESQSKFHDKVVFSYTTDIQRVDVTEWKGDHWFYADGINQFSSIDSWLFYEPFAYPVLKLIDSPQNILIIGGENGMLMNELKKSGITRVDHIPIDKELVEVASNEELFTRYNGISAENAVDQVIDEDVFTYLSNTQKRYDLVFVDVADPIDLERNQYFTTEFYHLIKATLTDRGLMVTQSGSPYFATEAYAIVIKTLESSGYNVLSYHNQILTLGEWSWAIASVEQSTAEMRDKLSKSSFSQFDTKWLNQEAMNMMMSFGKPSRKIDDLKRNTIMEPTLYKYYLNGNYTLR